MTADYPTDEVPATPEYVLVVLRDGLGMPADGDTLAFDWPVVDLLGFYNDLAWPSTRLLAECLNSAFATDIPAGEWKQAFPSVRGRTVREVCEFVAARISRPVIRPWRYLGGECLPAGAFLTVRAMFARLGAEPHEITPSSPLEPLLVRFHQQPWLGRLSRIAPGRLPAPRECYGFLGAGYGVVALAVGVMMLGLMLGAVGVLGIARLLLGLSCALVPVALLAGFLAGYRGPRRVELPGLSTFRDLAYCLAGQQPRRWIQPTP